jgi:hypothetical protein
MLINRLLYRNCPKDCVRAGKSSPAAGSHVRLGLEKPIRNQQRSSESVQQLLENGLPTKKLTYEGNLA